MNISRSENQAATYEDLLKVPANQVAELISGALYTHPRPAPRHALALSHLTMEVGTPFGIGRGGPGGWWILDEPELHLGADVLVPDIAGWRRNRLPVLPETTYFELAPDWVCEVHSPSTRRIDRFEKLSIYQREKVAYLWFVDPDTRGLEAYELRDNKWVLLASLKDNDKVCVAPFDAVTFSLGVLWP